MAASKQELVKWMTEQREGLTFESKVGLIWEFWSKKEDLYKLEKELTQFLTQEKTKNLPELDKKIRGLETDLLNSNLKISLLENQLEQTTKNFQEQEQAKHQEYLTLLEKKEKDWENKLKEALKKPTMVSKETKTDLSMADIAKMEQDLEKLKKLSAETWKQKKKVEDKISALEKERTENQEKIKELLEKGKDKEPNEDEKKLLNFSEYKIVNWTKINDINEVLAWLASDNQKSYNISSGFLLKREEGEEKEWNFYEAPQNIYLTKLEKANWNKLGKEFVILKEVLINSINLNLKRVKMMDELQEQTQKTTQLEKDLLLATKSKEELASTSSLSEGKIRELVNTVASLEQKGRELATELQKEKSWWDKWFNAPVIKYEYYMSSNLAMSEEIVTRETPRQNERGNIELGRIIEDKLKLKRRDLISYQFHVANINYPMDARAIQENRESIKYRAIFKAIYEYYRDK